MLVRVMLPPLGNSFYEATIPFSVTKIISQFGVLTGMARYVNIAHNGRRDPTEGAEGARDGLSVLSLETLRQKDYREMNP